MGLDFISVGRVGDFSVDRIIELACRNQTLVGKPKIFFFMACKGREFRRAAHVFSAVCSANPGECVCASCQRGDPELFGKGKERLCNNSAFCVVGRSNERFCVRVFELARAIIRGLQSDQRLVTFI